MLRHDWVVPLCLALAAALLAGCGAPDDDGASAAGAEPAPPPARIVRFAPADYADSVPAELAGFCQRALPSPAGPPVRLDTLTFARAPRTMMRIDRESHLDLALRCVVRSQREWDVVRPLTSIYADREHPAAPSVDFGREMLIVAAMGFRPTFSYDIWADGSWLRGDTLVVAIRGIEPGGVTDSDMVVNPVVVTRVPRARAVLFLER